MRKKILIIISILLSIAWSSKADNFHLELSQTTLIPGERVFIAVMLNKDLIDINEEPENAPIIHIRIYDQNKELMEHLKVRTSEGSGILQYNFSPSITGGTYFISATLYDEFQSSIVTEQTYTVQLLSTSVSKYQQFANHQQNERLAIKKEHLIKARDEFCFDEAEPYDFFHVIKQEVYELSSMHKFQSKNENFQKTLYAKVNVPPQYNLPSMYDLSKFKAYELRRSTDKASGSVKLEDFHGDLAVTYYDAFSKHIFEDSRPFYPTPKWLDAKLIDLDISDEGKLRLINQNEKRAILNHIFNPQAADSNLVSPKEVILIPDDEYIISDYQEFESLELFLKEVGFLIDIVGKGEKKGLVLLNGDTKRNFDLPPLLIINGTFQVDSKSLFIIPFNEIEKIQLFRKSSSIKQHFGNVGRHGVLMIRTKPSYKTAAVSKNFKGLSTFSLFTNPIDKASDLKKPYFSALQVFRVADDKLCYQHNDELGEFLVKKIRSSQTEIEKLVVENEN